MVLVPHELIGHHEERLELHVDLALAGRRDLVMVRLDDDADLAHLVDHLAAQIVERVGGAHGEVAPLEARLVAEIRFLDAACVPGALDRVDLVIAPVLVLLVADLVEDEEFRFRSHVTRVRNPAFTQVRLGLPGDVSRIAGELLARHRVDNVGDDADGWPGEERIEARGLGDRHGHHVRLLDPHPASNRRAVEAEAFFERTRIEMFDWERTVLPASEHVDELQVDHLGLVSLRELEELIGRRRVGIGSHGSSSLATAPTLRQARRRRNRELANDSFVRASERPQERFSEGRGNVGRPLIG